MCIADMAAGRRLIGRTWTVATIQAGAISLAADPRRMRLILSSYDDAIAVWAGEVATGSPIIATTQANGTQGWKILRVEDFGPILTGPLVISMLAVGQQFGSVSELVADYTLDQAVQRSVE